MLEGITLVISPLISLMQDQVLSLVQAGVPAAYINGSLSRRQFFEVLRRMETGRYKLVYVAPERLSLLPLLNILNRIRTEAGAALPGMCRARISHLGMSRFYTLKR
jgi:ATP-dependent DNA helicase RecQ